ncbi:MAG: S46 family peptidase [Bacteroidetes bacterium]|nr:S46 family peptidase [Bacteroidota bacterium]MBU1677645.1 S46 family peptidase [Bacteroidota bacterium]
MKQKFNLVRVSLFILASVIIYIGCSTTQISKVESTPFDTVQAKKFDTGKMWTFEHAPLEYFEQTYSFKPDKVWLDKVRMSALKFATWCTSSFVSEDGLIMTNHHCVDFITDRIEEEGENIHKEGFFAPTLADERKVPNLFVDQLVFIEDVTDEIISAMNQAKSDDEKLQAKTSAINDIQDRYNEETGLICKVTSLYNGGKFSLYGYKRYDDVRAVYINESEMGLWGGDPDNFTYPRYSADFAFCRVYVNDAPLKTDNYYKWSSAGAVESEPLFVIGNPGSTFRLKTMAQLEYYRDYTYRNNSFLFRGSVNYLNELIKESPEKEDEYNNTLFFVGNTAKVFDGMYDFLIDEYSMARKKDFEKKFKASVKADEKLNQKFGHLWQGIENTRKELRSFAAELSAYNINQNNAPGYFSIANNMIELAEQLELPDDARDPKYSKDNIEQTIEAIFPENFDKPKEDKKLNLWIEYVKLNLGADNSLTLLLSGGKKGVDAVNDLRSRSLLMNKKDVVALAKKGSESILNSKDPFIQFALKTRDDYSKYSKMSKEIVATEQSLENQLGQALFGVYGTTIPPDATFTLRISDGKMESYEYNGTVAPTFTTFYGMYDRYYSNDKKFPWSLPERWLNPEDNLNLSTPYNFITTHDITGGSSGSAVINSKAEVVGLAFDGNIQSIPGNFLYRTEENRMVSVSSQAMLEIMDKITSAKRISDELRLGKIPELKTEAEPAEVEVQ